MATARSDARSLSRNRKDWEKLGFMLREMRVRQGLRQGDLAKAVGQKQIWVSRYENAERRLDVFELRAVAEALGTTLNAVMRRLDSYEMPRGKPSRRVS